MFKNIEKKLKDAREKWLKKHKTGEVLGLFHTTPFDFHALSKRDGEKVYWLNPANQQHMNYGVFTVKELEQWINGKGPCIKSAAHWEHLNFILSIPNGTTHWHNAEHYNRHKPEYYDVTKAENHLALANDRFLDKESVKIFEAHVKARYIQGIRDNQMRGNGLRTTTEMRDEVYGMGYALKMMGVESRPGYSNTPTTRLNFAWWFDLLEYEAELEYMIQSGIISENDFRTKLLKRFK